MNKLREKSYVKEVITYESVIDLTHKEEAIRVLEEGIIDYITFASSSRVKNFITLIGENNIEKLRKPKSFL